jgi:hypothetical protein
LQEAFNAFERFIASETLADQTLWREEDDMARIEADSEVWRVAIEKRL